MNVQIDSELLGEAIDVIVAYRKLVDDFASELKIGEYPENKSLWDQWQLTESVGDRVITDIIKSTRKELKDARNS